MDGYLSSRCACQQTAVRDTSHGVFQGEVLNPTKFKVTIMGLEKCLPQSGNLLEQEAHFVLNTATCNRHRSGVPGNSSLNPSRSPNKVVLSLSGRSPPGGRHRRQRLVSTPAFRPSIRDHSTCTRSPPPSIDSEASKEPTDTTLDSLQPSAATQANRKVCQRRRRCWAYFPGLARAAVLQSCHSKENTCLRPPPRRRSTCCTRYPPPPPRWKQAPTPIVRVLLPTPKSSSRHQAPTCRSPPQPKKTPLNKWNTTTSAAERAPAQTPGWRSSTPAARSRHHQRLRHPLPPKRLQNRCVPYHHRAFHRPTTSLSSAPMMASVSATGLPAT